MEGVKGSSRETPCADSLTMCGSDAPLRWPMVEGSGRYCAVADVEVLHLSRRFDRNAAAALVDLSLSVSSGQFLVIVGPSGCGKSTALRIIAGLEESDEGEVKIAGKPMRNVAPQDRDVAMVFQGYALYPHMRARDILAFPLKMRGTDKAERQRQVEETAKLLGISHLLDRRPGQMSGGERQRVAMGRALVRRPKVFLFDEPLSNLDAALRAEIRVEIGTLVRKVGATTLYVTHDHVEAMTLGDRIAVMQKGHLEQVGSPREIYERPQTAFVASFLGSPSMNLNLATRDGANLISGGISLRVGNARSLVDKVLVGLRPEHIYVGTDAPEGAMRCEAKVIAVEPLGAETHLHLDAQGATLRAKIPGFDSPARDQIAPLWFRPKDIHAFACDGAQERLELALESSS